MNSAIPPHAADAANPVTMQTINARRQRPRWLFGLLLFIFCLPPLLLLSLKPAFAQDDLPITLTWTSDETDYTTRQVWGDYDNDGDLDLFVANGMIYIAGQGFPNRHNRLYCNEKGVLTSCWVSPESEFTLGAAWGDVDGDGDLDLVVGNGGVAVCIISCIGGGINRIYRNDTAPNAHSPHFVEAWRSPQEGFTIDVDWGDYDGDGDLDLAVGNGSYKVGFPNLENPVPFPQQNQVYINEGSTADGRFHFRLADNLSLPADPSFDVEWVDVNNDNHLDLAVANNGIDYVYCNNGARPPQLQECWRSTVDDFTISMSWGDYNNDGWIDVAMGNGDLVGGQRSRLYANQKMDETTNKLRLTDMTAFFPFSNKDSTLSIAWGDVDNDGDLDLATGNGNFSAGQPNRIFLNNRITDTITPTFSLAWSSPETDLTTSVAWGDVDNDGDLDLAVGNTSVPVGQNNRLYRNDTIPLSSNFSQVLTDTLPEARAVAWGDVDNDGDLDLAIGDIGPTLLYRNANGRLTLSQQIEQPTTGSTQSLAWGDLDNDGDLDLAVGNGAIYTDISQTTASSAIYCNTGLSQDGKNNFTLVWQSPPNQDVSSIAWGDYDNDGDLDLATGNGSLNSWNMPVGSANHIYRNDPSPQACGRTFTDVWTSSEKKATRSIAWGDLDGDGDLDLAVGNSGSANQLYRNDGILSDKPLFTLAWTSIYTDDTHSVAWGDMDGDGDLDLATGNTTQSNRVYCNVDGILERHDCWRSIEADRTRSVAWGDMDGDGDLDLAVGNQESPNQIYLNYGNRLSERAVWHSADQNDQSRRLLNRGWTLSVTWGDIDNDGDLDLATGSGQDRVSGIYRNTRFDHLAQRLVPTAQLTQTRASANFYASPTIWTTATLPITYTLWQTPAQSAAAVRGFYSLNGGGHWEAAVLSVTAPITNQMAGPLNVTQVYTWDIANSALTGQSDNVAFRVETLPSLRSLTNTVAGPFLYGSSGTQSYPFRVRGNQVRVIDEQGRPKAGALVYKLPRGRQTGGCPIGPGDDGCTPKGAQPYTTDSQGYLQGRSRLALGDQLLALAPVSATITYTTRYSDAIHLYHTNGRIDPTGTVTPVLAYTVAAQGVQTITVSAAQPLILFDLTASLEWDAQQDPAYRQQLLFDLEQASRYLYDFTNGQVALGKVTVFQDADHWAYTHLNIHATNRLRPYATIGGAVITDTHDFSPTIPAIYGVGQIHMGSAWNRYGEPNGNGGIDWPLILAHEFGHYFLFLEDTYLGLDRPANVGAEVLVNVKECTGSAMGDVYNVNNTEFITNTTHWKSNCSQTLAARELQRTEWQTIQGWFPELQAPTPTTIAGPNLMPFAFTTVEIAPPITPTQALDNQVFYLGYGGPADERVGSSEARAFLLRDDIKGNDNTADYLYDLGNAVGTQNLLRARGAQAGDTLCVFDRPKFNSGCEVIRAGDEQIKLHYDTNWNPIIQISPLTATVLAIQVTNLPTTTSGLQLQAQLYPEFGVGSAVYTLTQEGNSFSTIITLTAPTLNGHLHLWRSDQPRHAIVTYSISGNPGNSRLGGGGNSRLGGGGNSRLGGGGGVRGGGGNSRLGGGGEVRPGEAPVVSPDGQMIFFATAELTLTEGQFFSIQDMAGLPTLPDQKIAIGQGYNLFAQGFPTETNVLTGSVSFQYLGSDIILEQVKETELTIHFWDGAAWSALPTYVDPYFNLASARSQGPGVYALLAGVTTPTISTVAPTVLFTPTTILPSTAILTVTGDHFLEPVTLLLTDVVAYTITAHAINTQTITASLPITVTPAEYHLFIRNGDGGQAMAPQSLTILPQKTFCFYDDFESGANQWQRSGDWGIVAGHRAGRAMTDSPIDSYKDASHYADGTLLSYTTTITTFVKLDQCTNPLLTFDQIYQLAASPEGADQAIVESSTDGLNWTRLVTYTGEVTSELGCATAARGGENAQALPAEVTGEWQNGAWQRVCLPLPITGPQLWLRFSLEVNNDHLTSLGWIIDNVQIVATP